MAKNIGSMSNHELVAVTKALLECEMLKIDCVSCPCLEVICSVGNIEDCMNAKDAFICELGMRMSEMMNAN